MNEKIKEWLPIVLALISVAVMWGTMQARMVGMEQDIGEMKVRLTSTETCSVEMKVQLASIQRDILYMRQQLDLLMQIRVGGN